MEQSKLAVRGKPFEKAYSRKGIPNRTTRILKDAMLMAAEQAGDLSGIAREDLSTEGIEKGKDGLVGYLRWAAKCEPEAFLHILGKLIPVQMKVVYHSVEELQHDVTARGINLRAFGQLLLEAHKAKSGEFTTIGNGSDADSGRQEPGSHNGSDSDTRNRSDENGSIIDAEAEP